MLAQFVLPISAVIIVVLFAVQWRGTGSVGRAFGPVMAVWFLVIAVLGVAEIVHHPFVLAAVSPTYAVMLVRTVQVAGLRGAGRRGAVRHRRRGACMPTWDISARTRSD